MKVSKWMVLVICLVAFSVLIAGCGKKSPKPPPTPDPTPDPELELTELELNVGEEFDALKDLSIPGTYKGFTFNADPSKVAFDASNKTYGDVTYTHRFKTGGTGNSAGTNGVIFTAKKDDTLTVLAMSASTSGTGRLLMVAPVGGTGVNLGEVHTHDLNSFTYKLPADGEYAIYSSSSGINIYYISVFTNPPSAGEPKALTTAVDGEGTIELDPEGGSYEVGTVVTLEAKPAEGYEFFQWSGDLTGNTNPTTLTMNADKSVTAKFLPEGTKYTLTVAVNDAAMGSVSLDPDGGEYSPGQTVVLTAIPEDGYQFSKWSGDYTGTDNPTTITMDAEKSITAEFEVYVPTTPITLPFSEDFSADTYADFWTAAYKSLPGDDTAPMYYPTSGESKMSLVDGALVVAGALFTIGEKAPYTETAGTDTKVNGCFDLSRPYKISFKIVSITGTGKKLQVLIDNNTSSSSKSMHGGDSRIYSVNVDDHTVGQTLEIESSVGTTTSFIGIRVESEVAVGIDDLLIEYQ